MLDRFPSPGPSHRPEVPVRHGAAFRVGLSRPANEGDWWLAVLWVVDDRGVPRFRDLAPASGPPPEPPLLRLGPALAGALSGLILEEAGRLCIRLAPIAPPEDPARPWLTPAAVRAALKFEPLRAASMGEEQLEAAVLEGFARAVAGLARP